MTDMKKSGQPIKKQFTSDQLKKALFKVEDYMERAMCPFFVLGDTLKHVLKGKWTNDNLEGDEIELGIKATQLTKEVLSLFTGWKFNPSTQKDWDNTDTKLLEFRFYIDEVPIKIKVIHKNYSFFKNPDTIFFGVTEFLIPNPIKKYWKVRGLIA